MGRTLGWALAAVGVWLTASAAGAGAWLDGHRKHDCPPTAYSPLHVLTPELYRCYAQTHLPAEPLYAADRYPWVPNTIAVTRYRCPAVPPAAVPSPYLVGP
jgi:hypothetical protein